MKPDFFLTLLLTCLPVVACVSSERGTQANADAAKVPVSSADSPAVSSTTPPQVTRSAASTAGMVPIPAGEFTFGTSEREFEAFLSGSLVNFPGMRENLRKSFVIPQRKINLPEFYIDQFEVTNKQYMEFIRATGYTPADPRNYLRHWETRNTYPSWAEEFPVVWISQEDAEAYCAWRKGSLPTEQEWEKAARSTDARMFAWGNEEPGRSTTNSTSGKIEPTGNRTGDRSAYDVYDLAGNVAEITSAAPAEAGGKLVILRGGSFNSGYRAALTYYRKPVPAESVRSETTGCRCVVRK